MSNITDHSLGTPVEIALSYGYPIKGSKTKKIFDGSGQKIGIVDNGSQWNKETCLKNLQNMGVDFPAENLIEVSVGNAQTGGFVETQEDVDIVASICSKATIIVYSGETSAIIEQAIKDDVTVLTSSWGWNMETVEEKNDPAEIDKIEAALKKAVDARMTVCIAAGDAGSSGERQGSTAIPASDGLAHVQYPASSHYVLAVGGTERDKNGREVVWNNTTESPDRIGDKHGATGGGVSSLFAPLEWQTQAATQTILSVNPGTGAGRVVPDVAAYAGFGDYEMTFYKKYSLPNGGTSAAAPMWAALITLANQGRKELGKPPLGWLNKQLYQLAAVKDVFNDICEGDNKVTRDYPGYFAQQGFDACTGLGSPKADQLVPALIALP